MSNSAVTFSAIPKQYVLVRDAQVIYEPSVFGGNGGEQRVNMVLSVPDLARNQLKAIEDELGLGNTLCSCIKDDGHIRVKLDNDSVRIFDTNHVITPQPTQWKGVTIHALLEIRGHWKSRSGTGISVLCTDIQITLEPAPAMSPFQ